jgi:hypothetical protein
MGRWVWCVGGGGRVGWNNAALSHRQLLAGFQAGVLRHVGGQLDGLVELVGVRVLATSLRCGDGAHLQAPRTMALTRRCAADRHYRSRT